MHRLPMFSHLPLLLMGLVLATLGCERPAPPVNKSATTSPAAASSPAAEAQTSEATEAATPAEIEVEVEIDFRNDTPPLLGKLKLAKPQTAFAALEGLANQNGLKVNSKGTGETTFVVAIGEVANQGAGGINWTYRVNGELGDRSAGIFELKSGDKVAWIFGKYP